MVIVTFVVVILRYLFNLGWIWMQESITYLHGSLFIIACGYTLLKDEHVRVDIFYRPSSTRIKAIINLLGVIFLLFPLSVLIIYYGFPYVVNSWLILEDSAETGGIPAVFLLKTLVILFPILVFLQGISQALRSLLILMGDEEKKMELES